MSKAIAECIGPLRVSAAAHSLRLFMLHFLAFFDFAPADLAAIHARGMAPSALDTSSPQPFTADKAGTGTATARL